LRLLCLLKYFLFSALAILLTFARLPAGQQRISEDRDLKELDLTHWNCLSRPKGSARTPDGMERNQQKNRSAPASAMLSSEALDTPAFLKRLAEFEAQTKGKQRSDLSPEQRQQLEALEKQIVHFTGYLVAAYCGPPETTNCASVDFHDWHLELFEKPQDHPPQPGDPTPVICEITPRTQSAIYREDIRIQEFTAFFRHPDLTYESTGHPAQKIRVTGYLLWDDDHNKANDIGTTIRRVASNKYHQPWRSTAWEIHPVFKIEAADKPTAKAEGHPLTSPPAATTSAENASPTPAQSAPAAASEAAPESTPPSLSTPVPTSAPAPQEPSASVTPTPEQFVTVTQPVKIKIPYGENVLPRGAKLPIVSRDVKTVTVKYLAGSYVVPISSTDLPRKLPSSLDVGRRTLGVERLLPLPNP